MHLKREHGIQAEDVGEVVCNVSPNTYYISFEPKSIKYTPPDGYSAITSIPYMLGAALVEGRVTMAEVSDEKVKDPRILEMAKRVTHTLDPTMVTFCSGQVTIKMKDGRTFQRRQDAATGSPEVPASREMIEEKFRANAGLVLPERRLREIIEMVDRLEELDSVSDLMDLLRKE